MAQQAETVVSLPDSLGGMLGPQVLVWNFQNELTYVGGRAGDCVVPVHAGSLSRRARIPADRNITALSHVYPANKVYCAGWDSNTITVIDAGANRAVKTITGLSYPSALCYNSVRGKVYCSNRGRPQDAGALWVIDAERDSVRMRVWVEHPLNDACYSPASDRVYCAVQAQYMAVVDGEDDILLPSIPVPRWGLGIDADTAVSKVYLIPVQFPGSVVVDATSDTVLAELDIPGDGNVVVSVTDLSQTFFGVGHAAEPGHLHVVSALSNTVEAIIEVGRMPVAIEYNPVEGFAYCANAWSNTVSVIDCSGDSVRATIPVGGYPCAMACDTVNNRLVVANRESHDLTVIDCAGESVVGTVVLGDNYQAVCAGGDDRVYCAGKQTGLVTLVDAATNRVVANIPAADEAADLCWYPTGKVYCADRDLGEVAVIDAGLDTVVCRVPAGSGPAALCAAPGQGRVYCANYGRWPEQDSTVTVIDAGADTVVATLVVGNRPSALALNPVTGRAYCASFGADVVAVIEADSVRARVAVGRWPAALAVSPARNKVYCANSWGSTLSVIDGEGDTVRAEVTVGRQPSALCYVPGLDRVYCACDGSGRVVAVDCETDSVVATIQTGGHPVAVSCDTLRARVYVADTALDRVTVIDCTADTVLGVFEVGDEPVALAWNATYGRTYACNYSSSSLSVLRDTSVVGLAEYWGGDTGQGVMPRLPTVVRGVLVCPRLTADGVRQELLDALGRKAMELKPGANDVSQLAPGVYFQHSSLSIGHPLSVTTKVVIQR